MKTKLYSSFIILPSAFFLLLSLAPAPADDIPAVINYQGKLTDSAGKPLTNGQYTIDFRIWQTADGTNSSDYIWGRQFPLYVGSNGLFNVLLSNDGGLLSSPSTGKVESLVYAFDGTERYLGLSIVQVPGGAQQTGAPEIKPRQQFASAPFAARAQRAALATSAILASNALSFATYSTNDFLMSTRPNQTLTGSLTISNGTLTLKSNLTVNATATVSNLTVNGNVGKLQFGGDLGDKISIAGSSGGNYGIGISNRTLQVHTDSDSSDMVFGYLRDGGFHEQMRLTGLGNVGIGTSNPMGMLDVLGHIKIAGAAPIVIQQFSVTNIVALATNQPVFNTGFETNVWTAAIAGFTFDADVMETGKKYPYLRVRMVPYHLFGQPWTWGIDYFLAPEVTVTGIKIDVMFIRRELAEDRRSD